MILKQKLIRLLAVTVLSISLILSAVACKNTNDWDNLGGGGTGQTQDSADTSDTDNLSENGQKILNDIDENQQTPDDTNATDISQAIKIEQSGSYKLSGTISGQINVKAENVTLFLDNCSISNQGKKVISSDHDLIIVLVENTQNYISNTGENADSANAISGSGKITINGSGTLTISSTKSGIKADNAFFGLGGELFITAQTGHGISTDSCIMQGISITISSAEKDGIHAETDDEILIDDPKFDSSRGFVYIGTQTNINISQIYGDGIQADTYVLIDGGNINISTLPIFVKATSSDGCYKLSGGTYSKVASENSKNYSSLYQLQESCKGIKVGEIDYTITSNDTSTEYEILTETAYSIIINGGTFNISTTDDGLHTNSGNLAINSGNINIATSDDGISADKNVKINGGTIAISQSYEAIEGETIDIIGGTIKAVAEDDGINASNDASTAIQKQNCYIKISGGIIYVSSGGDGIDSNGGVQISGGELYVSGPTSGGDASLDSETGIIVSGGTIIALGSSGMVETPATNSTQYCISINLSTSISGGVTLKSNDETLISFTPSNIFSTNKNYQSILITCPNLTNGQTYSVISGQTTTSVTINGTITKVGNPVGGGGRR